MKQDAFAVAPDIVRQTRPFLAPCSIAGGTKDSTVAVPRQQPTREAGLCRRSRCLRIFSSRLRPPHQHHG